MKPLNYPRALGIPADTPGDQAWIYGLGYPVQLSSTHAGLFANIGRKDLLDQKKGDLEAGTDLVIFDQVVRDGLKEFGRNPEGHIRAVDHPSGRTLRLADGQWRHLLGFRILGPFEIKIGLDETVIAVPGAYLDEIVSDGAPAPEWKFS